MIAELEEVWKKQLYTYLAIQCKTLCVQWSCVSTTIYYKLNYTRRKPQDRVTEVCDNEIHNSFVLPCRADRYLGTVSPIRTCLINSMQMTHIGLCNDVLYDVYTGISCYIVYSTMYFIIKVMGYLMGWSEVQTVQHNSQWLRVLGYSSAAIHGR